MTNKEIKQCTIERVIHAVGVGVHTGKNVNLTLRPAPVDTGIIFRRLDFAEPISIKATVKNIGDTRLSSCLLKDGVRIATIEHLMAAFSGLGIDNIFVDLDAPEVPIMDGSAGPFVFLIQSAGIVQQEKLKKFIKIKEKIEVVNGDKRVALEPYNGFKVTFAIDFDHPLFNKNPQYVEVDLSATSFIKDISRARTFGFLADYEVLKSNNLALGCSLNNSIVVDDEQVINDGGLRYQNEFVKHKILDAIGDLYLLEYSVIGAFFGYKSGHTLNNLLLRKLLENEKAWELVTSNECDNLPDYFSEG
jgi:UDP-3-O-[3-hydroxymyristoyl] N-acetylglucosamine deacetylase